MIYTMNHERLYIQVWREVNLLRAGTRLRSGERIQPANDASKRQFRPARSQPFLPMKKYQPLSRLSGIPYTSPICAGCDAALGQGAVYVEQTTGKAFCRACYVISDSKSSFSLARQPIEELLTENANLKRQVDQLIKNGLSPEAKEIIELVAENLPETIHRAFQDRALRTAVEKYRKTGALQHSHKCTYQECACGLMDIFNALDSEPTPASAIYTL